MRSISEMIGLAVVLAAVSPLVLALEVDREVLPDVTLGGRVISTLDGVELDSDPRAASGVNVEDTLLLLSLAKRTYRHGIAGATLGFKEEDGVIVMQQAHTGYWTEDVSVILGRTRVPNTLIEFPILRDDDLLAYTHVGNAASNAAFDQVYGDLLSAAWVVDQGATSVDVWGGSRGGEGALTVDGLNSYGVGYRYDLSPRLRYLERLRHAGILVDRQKFADVAGDEQWMTAVVLGAEFNINDDPSANWSMAAQLIANGGVDDVMAADLTGADAVAYRARAASRAATIAVRYTGRPALLTRWQAALNLAYKDYSHLTDAQQWSVMPSAVYVLGQGIDLLAQAGYTRYGDALGGGRDVRVQLGMAFSFDATFRKTIGDRNSILNLEHGYLP